MNKLELRVIEYVKGLLNEFEVSDITTGIQELFNNFEGLNLMYNEDIEQLFKLYSVDITNYYLNNFEYTYNCNDITDMTLIVLADIVLNYMEQ